MTSCSVSVPSPLSDELRALSEVEWRLLVPDRVLQPMRQVRVGRKHLRIGEPAVDRERKGEMVVAHHVAQRNGGSSEYPVPEVVARVAHRGPGDEIRRESDVVLVLLELRGVRKPKRATVEDRGNADARLDVRRPSRRARPMAGRLCPTDSTNRRANRGDVESIRAARAEAALSTRCASVGAASRIERLALEQPRIVDRPDGVLAVLQIRERHLVGRVRPRDRRG